MTPSCLKWTDRLGYLLVIIGTVVYFARFSVIIVYGTDYFLNGSQHGLFRIVDRREAKGEMTYRCKPESAWITEDYTSAPTSKDFRTGSLQHGIISPTFIVVLFGRILLFPYLVSIFVLIFLLAASVRSVRRIFNNTNKKS